MTEGCELFLQRKTRSPAGRSGAAESDSWETGVTSARNTQQTVLHTACEVTCHWDWGWINPLLILWRQEASDGKIDFFGDFNEEGC